MKISRVLTTVLQYAASLTLLIGLWEACVRLLSIPPYLLPDPVQVFETLGRESPVFLSAAILTFGNMLAGSAIGISLGLVTGLMIAYSPTIRWIAEPYLTAFQSFPRESFFPLFVVWLGFGALPKIVNAALLSYFPTAVVTLAALTDTRDDYIRLMEVWKASRFQEFVYCRVPAAVPSMVGSLKVALPLALIGAVLGEFLGGSGGLGYIIISSGSTFRIDRVFAAIMVLAAGGILMIAIVNVIQQSLLHRFYQS